MTNQERVHCPTCGHVVAKQKVKLSSIEFRRRINGIASIEEFNDFKPYLERFVYSHYKNSTNSAEEFLNNLEGLLTEEVSINSIKIWILRQHGTAKGEMHLYKFLQSNYPSIDEPFSKFYERYTESIPDPMTKNCVSRALSAFGLKSIMKRIICDKAKCTMVLCASQEELSELFRRNAI